MRSATIALFMLVGCSSNSNADSKVRDTGGSGGATAEGDGGRASGGDESDGGEGPGKGSGGATVERDGGRAFGGNESGGGGSGNPPSCGGSPDHGPTATLQFVLPGDYAATRASTATLCRNESCSTAELAALNPREPPIGSDAPLEIAQVAGQSTRTDVRVRHANEGFVLAAEWRALWYQIPVASVDTYTVTVTSAEGRPLVLKQTATYERHPQVTDCDVPWVVAQFGTPEGELCCPRDSVGPASELYMGGLTRDGQCWETHDFWCTENFRVESVSGCESWKYDDIPACTPDAGSSGNPDAGHD